MPILLPDQYGYVLLAATSTFFVNTYHSMLMSGARKASGIKYPTAYASSEQAEKDPKAFRFNCAQRAHANFTESLTPLLGALFTAGLRFPIAAAACGAGWALARVVYAYGYTSDAGPEGRIKGSIFGFLFDTTLKFMALYSSVMFVLGQ